MVADKFTDLQKAVGPEITKTDLVPAFQVKCSWLSKKYQIKEDLMFFMRFKSLRLIVCHFSEFTKRLRS